MMGFINIKISIYSPLNGNSMNKYQFIIYFFYIYVFHENVYRIHIIILEFHKLCEI